jgi:hypothetical protein
VPSDARSAAPGLKAYSSQPREKPDTENEKAQIEAIKLFLTIFSSIEL